MPVGAPSNECLSSPNAHAVTEYGSFVANNADPAVASANQDTLNRAIDQLGNAGGGTICLPAGRYNLGFKTGFAGRPGVSAAVWINKSNITLWGAGKTKTILATPAEYRVVNNAVVRGHGIYVMGTTRNTDAPISNLTFKQFELNGQTGWTGVYGFPARTFDGDGWDITNKGIVPSQDSRVDNVLLEDFTVRNFRGEMIYVGGREMGRLRLNRVLSTDTNASTYNVTANAVVENSEFGLSRFWIEIGTAFPNNAGIFNNNYFHDARGASGIALAQGDGLPQPYRFTNNRFENCTSGVFAFLGGVGGPIHIVNNKSLNCDGRFVAFGSAPNTVVAGLTVNKNITVENNTISGASELALFGGWAENVVIRNNLFTGKDPASGSVSGSVVYGVGQNYNVQVVGNTFKQARSPQKNQNLLNVRPFFAGNNYDPTRVSSAVVKAGTLISPQYEIFRVHSDGQQRVVDAILDTQKYPDGQVIQVFGGASNAAVRFPAGGQNGYSVASDKLLDGSTTFYLRFDAAEKIWREVAGPTATTATGG